MKELVVFYPYFGNAEKIATLISESLKKKHYVKLIKVDDEVIF